MENLWIPLPLLSVLGVGLAHIWPKNRQRKSLEIIFLLSLPPSAVAVLLLLLRR